MERGLVELARRGDHDAFAALAQGIGDRLMAIAYRILRDVHQAEDAVQQALEDGWRDLPSLRDPDRFEAWMHSLLVHACYAAARRERRLVATVRLLPTEGVVGRDDTLSVADRDQLERGFRRLAPEQRAVFVFHHYLGLSLPEIAVQLGMPLGTAKSRLSYATAALRAALEADARTSTEHSA